MFCLIFFELQVLYDLDDGDNGQTFSITTIGGRGVIRLIGKLDFEERSLYQLRVLARDRPGVGKVHTATAVILVKIEDVEDQPPIFMLVPPVTRLAEDTPTGSSLLARD